MYNIIKLNNISSFIFIQYYHIKLRMNINILKILLSKTCIIFKYENIFNLQNHTKMKQGELPLRVGWGKKLPRRVGKFDNSSEGLTFLLDQFTLN